jgi:hypothetical protein
MMPADVLLSGGMTMTSAFYRGILLLAAAATLACSNGTTGTGDATPGDIRPADAAGDLSADAVAPPPDGGGDAADILADTAPACEDGERICVDGNQVHECHDGGWMMVTLCPETHICAAGTCVEKADCEPGTVDGCYSLNQYKQCNEEGNAWIPVACAEGEFCVAGGCKVTDCLPGKAECVDPSTRHVCGDDGNWLPPQSCGEDLVCVGGKCLDQCLSDPKWNSSYIGCEYWTLDLDNYPDPSTPVQPDEALHGIIIGNPGEATAKVTFTSFATGIDFPLIQTEVEAGQTKAVELPRMDINGSTITDRSVRVKSNRPVVVYQFNPLDFQEVYSDDSSLLLPAEMLGKEYLILTYPTTPLEAFPMINMPSQHGYFTVLAVESGETHVSVKVTAITDKPDAEGETLKPGPIHQFTLQQGEVLNLQADGATTQGTLDLSGSHVIADKKVAVFAGHEEAVVQGLEWDPQTGQQADCCCAEHMEEQLFPLSTWSDTYLCIKARPRGESDLDLWRIQAGTGNVTLTTDPPVPGLDGVTLAGKGEWVQAFSKESFVVYATGPIQVAQYLSSQTCTEDATGDPAMIMAVAETGFRTPYAFAVPKDYSEDYITVIRPAGATVTLDTTVLSSSQFHAVGQASGYEYGYFPVADGPHFIHCTEPFGLYQYGFHGPASYGNPGGLNLVQQQ